MAVYYVWDFFPPFSILMIVTLLWGLMGFHPQFRIYSDGIYIYRLGFSQFLTWNDIKYVHEWLRFAPFTRDIIIGSNEFPKYRVLFGFSLWHLCPRVRLSKTVHRNYDEARAIIMQNMEAVKTKEKRKRLSDHLSAVKAKEARDQILDHVEAIQTDAKSEH